jgi:hypothetical protein
LAVAAFAACVLAAVANELPGQQMATTAATDSAGISSVSLRRREFMFMCVSLSFDVSFGSAAVAHAPRCSRHGERAVSRMRSYGIRAVSAT